MKLPITLSFKLAYADFTLDVDLCLPATGVTVFFGHSGSGKTTLLRCISGLEKSAQGYFQINGSYWQHSEQAVFVPTYQRALGYVFQEANLFPHLTVAENLQFGLKRIGKSNANDGLQQTLALLGIEHLLTRMPEHLSGGERQRVAIARALALNPEILLMDEPLASLDLNRKQELLPYFLRLHEELNIPVLYVTHSLQEVAQLGDHLVIMENGRVVAEGALSDTLSRLDLSLAKERQAASVWEVTIIEHEQEHHLTRVSFDGGDLSLPAIDLAVGSKVRVQIFASDVSIALQAPTASSILNILPALVDDLVDHQPGQSVLRLLVGKQKLLAHITSKSARMLGLDAGKPVYVQIKGTSILN